MEHPTLAVYTDGSLTKKDGKRQIGYGAAGYYLGKQVFERQGALGEQAEVFDAKMTGLSVAGEEAKLFILNPTTNTNHILRRQHRSYLAYLQGHTRKGPDTISHLQETHKRYPKRSRGGPSSHQLGTRPCRHSRKREVGPTC